MTWLILAASGAVLLIAFFLRRHAEKRVAALGLADEVIYSDARSKRCSFPMSMA